MSSFGMTSMPCAATVDVGEDEAYSIRSKCGRRDSGVATSTVRGPTWHVPSSARHVPGGIATERATAPLFTCGATIRKSPMTNWSRIGPYPWRVRPPARAAGRFRCKDRQHLPCGGHAFFCDYPTASGFILIGSVISFVKMGVPPFSKQFSGVTLNLTGVFRGSSSCMNRHSSSLITVSSA